jgi:hypothetical protein
MKITRVGISGPDAAAFAVSPDLKGVTVDPGATREFWIRFTARHPGLHTAALVISRAPATTYPAWRIRLTGTGLDRRIDCGRVALGRAGEAPSFTVGGTWQGEPLRIVRVELTGPDARAFRLDPDIAGLTLHEGDRRDFMVRFTPTHPGPHSARMTVYDEPAPWTSWSMPLAGTGVAGAAVAGSSQPAPVAPPSPSPVLPIALIGGGGIAAVAVLAFLKTRKVPMPQSEIVALGTAIAKADACAKEGKVADGLALLVSGLRRAEQERRRGSRWAGEAATRWQEAMDRYATQNRLGPAAEIAPAHEPESGGGERSAP